jgi:transcriptional regulator with XRE-family HTH domain
VIRAWPMSSRAPDRTTLWRWLKGESNIAPQRVLELAGAFDIDPLSLFQTTPKAYAVMCRALAKSIGSRNATPLGHDLQWLREFIAPNEEWPSQYLAAKFYDRTWKLQEFSHSARDRHNYFQKVSIKSPPRTFGEPQVWHFAFRGQSSTFPLWTPYGFIERRSDEIALYHYRGATATADIHRNADKFTVETWFGTGAAEFRVASLHAFELALTKTADSKLPCIRFP